MWSLIVALMFIVLALMGPRALRVWAANTQNPNTIQVADTLRTPLRLIFILVALYLCAETSFIHVPGDQVGVVRKLYGYSNLPEGHIIATNGETGYQAEIIPPGTFRISPFFNIINDIEYKPIVKVPNGFYGRIVARDGEPLDEGQIMADAWTDEQFGHMLDAQYFMTHHGKRGEQLSVLKPGNYPLNTVLFQVKIGYEANGKDILKSSDDVYDETGYHSEQTPLNTKITVIPAGFVGVVRSSVASRNANCVAQKVQVEGNQATRPLDAGTQNDNLSADLVPQNCKGIWRYALPPNDYYLNRDAYDVTLMDTKVQTLEFKGGFLRRWIDLTVNSKGEFEQRERRQDVPIAADAVDVAVNTKVEGWEIPQELRVVVQISPEHAPIIVAAVGGLKEVEQRIMIPSIRSHVRNVYGGYLTVAERDKDGTERQITRPTKVLDTVEQRPALEDEILRRIQIDGRRAGVDVKEIRLGESVIPPELLLARQRQQLAEQLKAAFVNEQAAQEQRQKTEQARATADQQSELVRAQIGLQAAKYNQDKRQAEGHGERLFLEEQAAGQQAQTNVLGKENVVYLQQVDYFFKVLKDHPEILANLRGILPQTVFIGGKELENAAGLVSMFGRGATITLPPGQASQAQQNR